MDFNGFDCKGFILGEFWEVGGESFDLWGVGVVLGVRIRFRGCGVLVLRELGWLDCD